VGDEIDLPKQFSFGRNDTQWKLPCEFLMDS